MNWADAFGLVVRLGTAIYDGVKAGKSAPAVLADAHSVLDEFAVVEADVDAAAAGHGRTETPE